MSQSVDPLFQPFKLGALELPNRIVMAPLTRGRGTREHVPTPLMAKYYAQRASAGLIISEATGISQQGLGWPYAPGLWNDEQVRAWSPVVEAVVPGVLDRVVEDYGRTLGLTLTLSWSNSLGISFRRLFDCFVDVIHFKLFCNSAIEQHRRPVDPTHDRLRYKLEAS